MAINDVNITILAFKIYNIRMIKFPYYLLQFQIAGLNMDKIKSKIISPIYDRLIFNYKYYVELIKIIFLTPYIMVQI